MQFQHSRHHPQPLQEQEQRPPCSVVLWDASLEIFRVEDLNRLVENQGHYVVCQTNSPGCVSLQIYGPYSVRFFATQQARKMANAKVIKGADVFGTVRNGVEFIEFCD